MIPDLRAARVLVVGLGRSGLAAIRTLHSLGACVTAADARGPEELSGHAASELRLLGVSLVRDTELEQALAGPPALLVTSPGVPRTSPLLRAACERGVTVWGEIELAYRLTSCPIIAITGTNGKTTTTFLTQFLLEERGMPAIAAGNISADSKKCTLIEAAEQCARVPAAPGTIVAEVSSFQLEWVDRFAPKAAVLTNITPDHMNRHASFEEYVATKARIFAAQSDADWAICGADNPASKAIGLTIPPERRCMFTLGAEDPGGGSAWVEDGQMHLRLRDRKWLLGAAADLPAALPGPHNVLNFLAACAAAAAVGADVEDAVNAVRAFPGVPHRMEPVAVRHRLQFINNSMCTNVEAGIASLNAVDRPAVVIAGGADKALDFLPLAETMRRKARALILIGSAAEVIERAMREGGFDRITRCATLQAAVDESLRLARPGDVVILCPCCASFDMFADFEARGAAFRSAVLAIPDETA